MILALRTLGVTNHSIGEGTIPLTEEEMILLTEEDQMTVLTVEVIMIPLTEGSLMTLWTAEVRMIRLIPIDHVNKTCPSHLPNITTCLLECPMGEEALRVILKILDIIKLTMDKVLIAIQECKVSTNNPCLIMRGHLIHSRAINPDLRRWDLHSNPPQNLLPQVGQYLSSSDCHTNSSEQHCRW